MVDRNFRLKEDTSGIPLTSAPGSLSARNCLDILKSSRDAGSYRNGCCYEQVDNWVLFQL